jgi:drug/metabolite transporter (DMT)-like permease
LGPGMEGLDSIMVASFRTPALALVLFGIVAMRGTFPKLKALTRRDWVILVVGGIIGWGLGSMLFLLSVQLVGPTRAAILTSTAPLFALPMSVIFLKEEVNRMVLVGTAITVLGVILVA